MTRQSYLVYADKQLAEFMLKERRFLGLVFTHKNKGKVYPYASKCQNNRKKFIRYPV